MSYTARPSFTGNQNQQQQSQQGSQSNAPSGIPNLPMMGNAASSIQTPVNPNVPTGMSVIEQQKLLQQQALIFQSQLLMQQNQAQQQQQQQKQQLQNQHQHQHQQKHQDVQALNRLVSELSKNGGNLAHQQQLQQLVQISALNMLNQAQAQQAAAQHVAHQQQQKSFQQQSVPLPPNTTITPIARQNMQSAPKTPTNYARSTFQQQPKAMTQSPNTSSARNKNLPITAKSATQPIPPSIVNPSLANLSAVTDKRFIDLVAQFSRNNQATPASSSLPYSKPNTGVTPNKQPNVTAMSSPSMQKPNLPELSIANAALASRALQPPPSISVSVTNKPNISPANRNVPVSPLKLNTAGLAGPQKLSPTSPRTKQTPRKSSNPIKTTPSPTATLQAANPLAVSLADAKLPVSQTVSISSAAAKSTVAPPPPVNLVSSGNAAKVANENTVKEVKAATPAAPPASVQKVEPKAPITSPVSIKPAVTPKIETSTAASVATKTEAPVAIAKVAAKTETLPVAKVEKPDEKAAVKVETKVEPIKTEIGKAETQQQKLAPSPQLSKEGTSQSAQSAAKVDEKAPSETEKKATPKTPAAATTQTKTSTAKSTSKSNSTQSAKSEVVETRVKRNRLKTIPYQSPTPEFELVSKISAIEANNSLRHAEDKLTLFYKNEFLAVRNADGGFFLCQTMNNVYKSSPKIRIRWLSEEAADQNTFTLDFYDTTDIECVLTSVVLNKQAKGKFVLTKAERERIESILKKALDVEKGIVARPDVTEENPDGLDLSLYKDESQIEKKTPGKRKSNDRAASAKSAKQSKDEPKSQKSAKRTPASSGKKKKPVAKKSPAKKTPAKLATPTSSDKIKSSAKKPNEIESTPVAKKPTTKRKLIDEEITSNTEADSTKIEKASEEKTDGEPEPKKTKVDESDPKAAVSSEATTANTDSAAQSTQESRATRRNRN